MARLRKLGEGMKPSAATSSSQVPAACGVYIRPTHGQKVCFRAPVREQERAERQRLDKKLAILGDSNESTEALQAMLEKVDSPCRHSSEYTDL